LIRERNPRKVLDHPNSLADHTKCTKKCGLRTNWNWNGVLAELGPENQNRRYAVSRLNPQSRRTPEYGVINRVRDCTLTDPLKLFPNYQLCLLSRLRAKCKHEGNSALPDFQLNSEKTRGSPQLPASPLSSSFSLSLSLSRLWSRHTDTSSPTKGTLASTCMPHRHFAFAEGLHVSIAGSLITPSIRHYNWF
jgi:hypothetical protein